MTTFMNILKETKLSYIVDGYICNKILSHGRKIKYVWRYKNISGEAGRWGDEEMCLQYQVYACEMLTFVRSVWYIYVDITLFTYTDFKVFHNF